MVCSTVYALRSDSNGIDASREAQERERRCVVRQSDHPQSVPTRRPHGAVACGAELSGRGRSSTIWPDPSSACRSAQVRDLHDPRGARSPFIMSELECSRVVSSGTWLRISPESDASSACRQRHAVAHMPPRKRWRGVAHGRGRGGRCAAAGRARNVGAPVRRNLGTSGSPNVAQGGSALQDSQQHQEAHSAQQARSARARTHGSGRLAAGPCEAKHFPQTAADRQCRSQSAPSPKERGRHVWCSFNLWSFQR